MVRVRFRVRDLAEIAPAPLERVEDLGELEDDLETLCEARAPVAVQLTVT